MFCLVGQKGLFMRCKINLTTRLLLIVLLYKYIRRTDHVRLMIMFIYEHDRSRFVLGNLKIKIQNKILLLKKLKINKTFP